MSLIRDIKDIDAPYGLRPRACERCQRRDGFLLRCSCCKTVYYCGRGCQVADRPRHKKPCKAISAALRHFDLEYTLLRDKPSQLFLPERVLETCVGRFWGIFETRSYMRARFGVVDTLLRNYGGVGGSADVVQTALGHLLEMMRLCRSDNMGLRHHIAPLLIRLDRDQESYDFIKWYINVEKDDTYDWGDMDLPFLDVKNADMLEAPPKRWFAVDPWLQLSHVVPLLLIKVRIWLDLRAIRNLSWAVGVLLPQDLMDRIGVDIAGRIVLHRSDLRLTDSEQMASLAKTLKSDIWDLYRAVDNYSEYFWDILLDDPDEAIEAQPGCYSPRSEQEALLMGSFNVASWYETPGAVEVLRRMREADVEGSCRAKSILTI
ncbi:MYND finger [Ophiocordyceps camponoti-floridani]|uniref:MYND finger n=1 Tax=Ophiocordyceps camponoti-floridani TaxID=2030778 RepID=A0A8H4QAU4_9HYPO|nr:MYND finger [Ophiocordyceps camponoti-floridani]